MERYYPDGERETAPDACELIPVLRNLLELIDALKMAVQAITYTVVGTGLLLLILQVGILRRLAALRRRIDGLILSDLPETLPTVSRLIQAVAVGLSWPIPAATWLWQQILAKKE